MQRDEGYLSMEFEDFQKLQSPYELHKLGAKCYFLYSAVDYRKQILTAVTLEKTNNKP